MAVSSASFFVFYLNWMARLDWQKNQIFIIPDELHINAAPYSYE